MRRLPILLLSILLAIVFCYMTACSSSGDTQTTENGVMVELKNSDGSLTGYERLSYDADGRVTRRDMFDTEKTCLYFILYTYDDNGLLYTETRYSGEGFAEYRYVYTYDDDGNLTEKAYESPTGEAEVTRYDSDGSEVERLYYGTDEKLAKREVFEDGKWVVREVEDATEAQQ